MTLNFHNSFEINGVRKDNVPSEILTFKDLQDHAIDLFNNWDLSLINTVCLGDRRLFERFIHTFLEWDQYDEYVYNTHWRLNITIDTSNNDPSPYMTKFIRGIIIRVNTLNEAKTLAEKRICDILGVQLFLRNVPQGLFKYKDFNLLIQNHIFLNDTNVFAYDIVDSDGDIYGTAHLTNLSE